MVPVEGIEPPLLAEHDFEFVRVYQFRHTGIERQLQNQEQLSPCRFSGA